jgi:hypothetical protein
VNADNIDGYEKKRADVLSVFLDGLSFIKAEFVSREAYDLLE